MKKLLIILVMVLVATSLFANTRLFVLVDLDGDRLAGGAVVEEVYRLLDQRGGFVPANLEESDVELIINGMKIMYQGSHVGYALAATVVFHDPNLVRFSNTRVMTSRNDLDGLRWAADVSVNYLYSFFE